MHTDEVQKERQIAPSDEVSQPDEVASTATGHEVLNTPAVLLMDGPRSGEKSGTLPPERVGRTDANQTEQQAAPNDEVSQPDEVANTETDHEILSMPAVWLMNGPQSCEQCVSSPPERVRLTGEKQTERHTEQQAAPSDEVSQADVVANTQDGP